jgi:CheY-like chemotaxis protein
MAATESRASALKNLRPPRRVLLVEDDADALEVLTELLETGGDEVSVSCTGTAALALARLVRPDVVVMDLRLPDTDGVDLIRTLWARTPPRPSSPSPGPWEPNPPPAPRAPTGSCRSPTPTH